MFWFVELKLNSPGTFTGKNIASHEHVLRGSSRVPARRTSADLSEKKKNVDQSQQTSRSGKCTLDLEKFPA